MMYDMIVKLAALPEDKAENILKSVKHMMTEDQYNTIAKSVFYHRMFSNADFYKKVESAVMEMVSDDIRA